MVPPRSASRSGRNVWSVAPQRSCFWNSGTVTRYAGWTKIFIYIPFFWIGTMIDIYKIILFSSLVISLQAKIFSVLPLHNCTAQGILVLRARVPCRGVYLAAWNGRGMKERKSTWSAKANQVLFKKWRRRWDSNPRAVSPATRFRDTQSICTLAEHRPT